MSDMTGRERIINILEGKPVDRIGVFEEFWSDTARRWISEGHIDGSTEMPLQDHFGWDIEKPWPFNFTANPRAGSRILAETEETVTYIDGNGATLRSHKLHVSTPEHISFVCHDRESWLEQIKPFYSGPISDRVNVGEYRYYRSRAEKKGTYMLLSSWHVFQNLVNLCGHENLLYGMADDPEWIDDMVGTIADLSLAMHEELISKEGKPDGLYLMEDLGYKQRPFFSPAMFRRFFKPVYTRFADFAHANGLKLFFHSCGYIEPLLPDLVDCGIDCLTAMEHKAGMDVKRIAQNFGDRIALLGGLDVRVLESNDVGRLEAFLQDYIPFLKQYRYILATDHSTSDRVNYETFTYFINRGLELGRY